MKNIVNRHLLLVLFITVCFQGKSQNKWWVSGHIGYDNIFAQKQKKVIVDYDTPIDTNITITHKKGHGMILSFQIEKRWENFSIASGINFIPVRSFSENGLAFLFSADTTQLQATLLQQKTSYSWNNEIELPVRFRYYFQIPKSKFSFAPSFSFILGTATNKIILEYPDVSINKTLINESTWFFKRFTYQFDLSLFYKIDEKNLLSLGYYRQYNIKSNDVFYILRGFKFGIHKSL